MENSNYKLNLIDYDNGCIIQKDFDHMPNFEDLKKLKTRVQNRKEFKSKGIKFDGFELLAKSERHFCSVALYDEIIRGSIQDAKLLLSHVVKEEVK